MAQTQDLANQTLGLHSCFFWGEFRFLPVRMQNHFTADIDPKPSNHSCFERAVCQVSGDVSVSRNAPS